MVWMELERRSSVVQSKKRWPFFSKSLKVTVVEPPLMDGFLGFRKRRMVEKKMGRRMMRRTKTGFIFFF